MRQYPISMEIRIACPEPIKWSNIGTNQFGCCCCCVVVTAIVTTITAPTPLYINRHNKRFKCFLCSSLYFRFCVLHSDLFILLLVSVHSFSSLTSKTCLYRRNLLVKLLEFLRVQKSYWNDRKWLKQTHIPNNHSVLNQVASYNCFETFPLGYEK